MITSANLNRIFKDLAWSDRLTPDLKEGMDERLGEVSGDSKSYNDSLKQRNRFDRASSGDDPPKGAISKAY